jgi:hypothetical protein
MEKSVATAKVSMHYVPSNGHVFRHREIHIRLLPYDHDVRLCNDTTNYHVWGKFFDKNNTLTQFQGASLCLVPAFLFARAHTRCDPDDGIRASDITELCRATRPLIHFNNHN